MPQVKNKSCLSPTSLTMHFTVGYTSSPFTRLSRLVFRTWFPQRNILFVSPLSSSLHGVSDCRLRQGLLPAVESVPLLIYVEQGNNRLWVYRTGGSTSHILQPLCILHREQHWEWAKVRKNAPNYNDPQNSQFQSNFCLFPAFLLQHCIGTGAESRVKHRGRKLCWNSWSAHRDILWGLKWNLGKGWRELRTMFRMKKGKCWWSWRSIFIISQR